MTEQIHQVSQIEEVRRQRAQIVHNFSQSALIAGLQEALFQANEELDFVLAKKQVIENTLATLKNS